MGSKASCGVESPRAVETPSTDSGSGRQSPVMDGVGGVRQSLQDRLFGQGWLTFLCICLTVCLFVCLSVRLSVCLSVSLFVCLDCRYVYMYVFPYGCLSLCLSVFLSVCLFVCLSVCLFVFTYVPEISETAPSLKTSHWVIIWNCSHLQPMGH